MAAKKNMTLETDEIEIQESNEPDYGEVSLDDSMTVKIEQKQASYKGPMVEVYLPKLEDEGNGVKVDQYEHVTIANEAREWTWHVQRGVRVQVPVPVFVALKQKYDMQDYQI